MTVASLDGPEALEALYRARTERIFHRRDVEAIDRFYHPDCEDHTLPPGFPRTRGGMKAFYRQVFHAFPDCRVTLEDLLVDGDRMAARWTFRATHRAGFLGLPATGARVEVTGCELDRVRAGRIVEVRGAGDLLALLHQIAPLEAVG